MHVYLRKLFCGDREKTSQKKQVVAQEELWDSILRQFRKLISFGSEKKPSANTAGLKQVNKSERKRFELCKLGGSVT